MLLEGGSFEADARGHAARGVLVPAHGVPGAVAPLLAWRGRVLLRRAGNGAQVPSPCPASYLYSREPCMSVLCTRDWLVRWRVRWPVRCGAVASFS